VSGFEPTSTVSLPLERTEYYTPAPIRWNKEVTVAPKLDGSVPETVLQGPDVTYRAGSRQNAVWGAAVVGPSLAVPDHTKPPEERDLVARHGDTLRATLPLLSDSGGHTSYPRPEEYNFADTGDTSLYAGSTLVGSSGVPGEGSFTVPAGAANYRLVSSVQRNHAVWPLSTQVSAEWTFRSAHTDTATPLPLLTVGFTPPVDGLNHAAAGRTITIPVTVNRQVGTTGPQPALGQVAYSVDDGRTWTTAQARKTAGHWEVKVPNPASGFVSLRATAFDSAGNTVKQTIVRAYRVR
jgi:hypothetical protein